MNKKQRQVKQLRNMITALLNGAATLMILLIAPLGLAAVITNTILVMIASYFGGEVTDFVIGALRGEDIDVELLPRERSSSSAMERRRRVDLVDSDEDEG